MSLRLLVIGDTALVGVSAPRAMAAAKCPDRQLAKLVDCGRCRIMFTTDQRWFSVSP